MDILKYFKKQYSISEICLVFISTILLFLILIELKMAFVSFFSATLIYILFYPFYNYLTTIKKLEKNLSAATCLILSYTSLYFCFGAFLFTGKQISDFVELNKEVFIQTLNKLQLTFMHWHWEISDTSPQFFLEYIKSLSWGAMEVLSFLLLVHVFLFFLFFAKYQKGKMSRWFTWRKELSDYIRVKLLLATITALLSGMLYYFLGLDLALSLVMLVFLFDLIPNVGALISILVPLPIAYFQFGFHESFFILLVFSISVQVIIGNFIEPKLLSRSLGLSPLFVIFAILFWGSIWGSAGVFLAIPLSVGIKKFLENLSNPNKEFIN